MGSRSLPSSKPRGRSRLLLTVKDMGRAEVMFHQLRQAGSSWSDAIEAAAGNLSVSKSTLLDRMRKLRDGDMEWFEPPPTRVAEVVDAPPHTSWKY